MGSIFNLFTTETDDGNYYLVENKHPQKLKHKAYSDKSINREIKVLTSVLTNCKRSGQTLIWIAPFHEKIFSGLDKNLCEKLVWISPVNFYSPPPSIIDGIDKLNFFQREISRSDSFSIESHISFKSFDLQESFQRSIVRLIKNSAVRLKTIAHFSSLWNNNFRHNHAKWLSLPDISSLNLAIPDLFILGGPSVDQHVQSFKTYNEIWCADTALPALLHYNIIPRCVFSLDAGHGSYEHFILAIDQKKLSEMTLIIDPLSFPELFKLDFMKIFTCANSNPLIQETENSFTVVENETDDVFGFMLAVYNLLIKRSSGNLNELPVIIGHDGGHVRKATHLRGSAYHRRQYTRNNRLVTPELYFYRLSSRYTHS